GGATYTHATPPGHLAAAIPYSYSSDWGAHGYMGPSNIVLKDGFYYTAFNSRTNDPSGEFGAHSPGACVMRAPSISPGVWEFWDSAGGWRSAVNPHLPYSGTPADHVCDPISELRTLVPKSLSFNTYFDKYMLVGTNPGNNNLGPSGTYYSLSDD